MHGLGYSAAKEILIKHGPSWEISQLTNNNAAIRFWEKVIGRASSSKYEITLNQTKDKQTIKFEMA